MADICGSLLTSFLIFICYLYFYTANKKGKYESKVQKLYSLFTLSKGKNILLYELIQVTGLTSLTLYAISYVNGFHESALALRVISTLFSIAYYAYIYIYVYGGVLVNVSNDVVNRIPIILAIVSSIILFLSHFGIIPLILVLAGLVCSGYHYYLIQFNKMGFSRTVYTPNVPILLCVLGVCCAIVTDIINRFFTYNIEIMDTHTHTHIHTSIPTIIDN
eukprot:GHVR01155574.1.p1 GENE.GHVR01155574.1~~GHVR01155574.1.p1  ORF type:complete len:229 (+),score=30.70 GHVR01155574.1:31-687(+)